MPSLRKIKIRDTNLACFLCSFQTDYQKWRRLTIRTLTKIIIGTNLKIKLLKMNNSAFLQEQN